MFIYTESTFEVRLQQLMPSDFERQVQYRGLNVGHFLKYHSVEVPASVPAQCERIVKT